MADLRCLGLCTGPDMELALQALWPSKKQSLTAKLGTPGGSVGNFQGGQPSAAEQQRGDGAADLTMVSGLQVRQLLLRREDGPVRLLLAPLGGSIEAIARRLNPSAGKS